VTRFQVSMLQKGELVIVKGRPAFVCSTDSLGESILVQYVSSGRSVWKTYRQLKRWEEKKYVKLQSTSI